MAVSSASMPSTQDGSALPLPYDPEAGTPIVAVPITPTMAMARLTVRKLLAYVPDPIASEKTKEPDPRVLEYSELRREVQRAVEGAKAKNAVKYGRYLVDGLEGRHAWVTPPITLYHADQLQQVDFPGGQQALLLPEGEFLVAIDGETQRIAWQKAAEDVGLRQMVLDHRIAVIIHHGLPVEQARQAFYDLNVLEVKPNAAVAIGMDQRDPATSITKRLCDESDVLRGRVHLQRRQLRKSDPELMTISGLRQAVVCTILGEPGIQIGAKPITLNDAANIDEISDTVIAVWTPILEELEATLDPERRADVVVAAPAFLCGIGVIAHHAMPDIIRRSDVAAWTAEDVVEHLEGIIWEKELADGSSPWEGIGARKVKGERKDGTAYERWTLGGPKEVGYQVARALEEASSPDGQRVRRGS